MTITKEKSKKQRFLTLLSSFVAFSAIVGSLNPQEALASNPTQTLTFSDSLSQTQSQTLNIPNLVRVQSVKTNNGKVNHSINGEKLTITVSEGEATGQQYNAQKESKTVSNTLSNSSNVFPGTNSYTDANGYNGTLNMSGTSNVISGAYTPVDSKPVSESVTQTSNSFSATKSYNSGGYTGTLNKSGSITSQNVITGGYNQETGYYEDTGYYQTKYRSESYQVREVVWCYSSYWTWSDKEKKNVLIEHSHAPPCSGGGNAQYGDVTYYRDVPYQEWVNTGSRWVSTGTQWVNTYAMQYTQNYSGTVTKPESDTRVYQQAYSGTAYKSGYDKLYGYKVDVEYITDITPPDDATVKSSNELPTNKDVTISISYPSDAVLKEYKVGENGIWTNYTTPVILSSNTTVFTRSVDEAGNISNPTSFKVANIDKVAPETPSISVDASKNIVTLTNLTDVDSGVKETLYSLNAKGWEVYTKTFTLSDGDYDIQVKTIDNAENVSKTEVKSFSLYKERLTIATEKVELAENTRNQEDVDFARDLVLKMPPSLDKDSLLDRLTEVQNQIEAKNAIEKAEQTDKRPDYDFAVELVNKVKNSEVNAELKVSLEKQKDYLDFIDQVESLVIEAESKKTQDAVDKALVQVIKLETDEQSSFKKRLDAIQDYINAVKAVEKALETRDESDVEDAKTKIDLLDKTNPILVDLISDIEDSFEVADILSLIAKERFDILLPKYGMSKVAYESLVQSYYAIKYTGDFMFVRAGEKFTLVPQNDKYFALVKEQFTNLNVDYDEFVEERIQTQAEIKATSLVKTLEGNYSPTFQKQAQDLVNAVEDPKIRADLQKRLDDAKTKYEASKIDDASKKATESVEKAESSKQTYYITSAYKLVNGLTDDVLKTTLTERLVTLEAQIELDKIVTSATQAVENAERYKSATFVTTAQNKVTDLPDGEVKNALQLRLDNLKAGTTVTDQSLLVKKAENALSLAQSLKTQTYVDKAQTAIDLVEDETVKAELQAKLDAIVIK